MAQTSHTKRESAHDKFNCELQNLYEKQDYTSMIPLLEQLVRDDHGKSKLWKYRHYYRTLPSEYVKNSPIICYGLSILAVLSDDIEMADSYVSLLQKKLLNYRKNSSDYKEIESCLHYMEIALPHRNNKRTFAALSSLVSFIKSQGKNNLHLSLSLTANNPSIMDGGRDFSAYARYVPKIRGVLKGFAKILYGKQSVGMVDIATAEILYQQDKVYEALVLVASSMPFIEREGDVSILFVAMYLEFCILLVNGQVESAHPMIETMREKIVAAGADYLLPNLDAYATWAAMYDGNHEQIIYWLKEKSPNEFGEFCTIDRFCYFVKLRVYLLYGKHLSIVALSERLRLALQHQNRKKDLCELNMLLALSHFDVGEKDKAFELIHESLTIGEKYRYDRLFGNEGQRLYYLLRQYAEEYGESSYLLRVMELARKMALIFPHYLQKRQEEIVSLTDSEREVLQLIAAGCSNAQIGEFMNISINTVKFHSKNLFHKLNVNNRIQAMQKAKEHGIL